MLISASRLHLWQLPVTMKGSPWGLFSKMRSMDSTVMIKKLLLYLRPAAHITPMVDFLRHHQSLMEA
jgi:hypothetical protein